MSYIGNTLQVAYPSYTNIDDISGSFNGVTTSFALTVGGVAPVPAPLSSNQCMISVGGVIQRPDDTGTEGFRLSGGNIVFSSAPNTGEDFFGVILAGADYVNVGVNFPSGTASTPSITFDTDLDTGIYNPAANQLGITTGGTSRLIVDSSGNVTTGGLSLNGSAPSNSVNLDSSGRLLVGTSSAATAGTSQYALLAVKGNTLSSGSGGLISLQRGETSASGNITAGESIGALAFSDSDGQPYASILCDADGTSGTNDYPGRLVFSTTADGASSPTERMRIDSNGTILCCGATVTNPGSGNTSTGTVFEAAPDGGTVLISRTSNIPLYLNRNSDGNVTQILRSGTAVGSISVTTSSTAFNQSSDYRLKENVTAVTDGITRLQQLKPSRFNFIADPDTTVDGFIAHEVQNVVPEAITGEKDAVDADGNPEYQGIDQSKLVPLLTAALQEAVAKIESLEARLTAAGI